MSLEKKCVMSQCTHFSLWNFHNFLVNIVVLDKYECIRLHLLLRSKWKSREKSIMVVQVCCQDLDDVMYNLILKKIVIFVGYLLCSHSFS